MIASVAPICRGVPIWDVPLDPSGDPVASAEPMGRGVPMWDALFDPSGEPVGRAEPICLGVPICVDWGDVVEGVEAIARVLPIIGAGAGACASENTSVVPPLGSDGFWTGVLGG